jgi:hypothetical protein
MNFYQWLSIEMPFCRIASRICNFNMTTTIEKWKVQWESKEMVHMALVELMCIHGQLGNSILMD